MKEHYIKKIFLTLSCFFYYSFIFTICSNNAHAYIDPGGIGAIFNILLAGVATSIFYLRSYVYKILINIKTFFKDIKNFLKANHYKKIVIYIENLQYKKYFGNLIDYFEKSNLEVTLITDKLDDQLKNLKKIETISIHSDFLRNLMLSNINCGILILTTPDIGNLYVKKSKFCKHYLYIFHSVVSTRMVYGKNAFKNYDTICCNGDYQLEELKKLNKQIGNNKQQLLQTGYPYFDILYNYQNDGKFENNKIKTIFIAPSWDPKNKDLYNEYYKDLINKLLIENYKIIFRPHPEYVKRFANNFKNFNENFLSNLNFTIDTSESLTESFQGSDILITDWSGISFEYNFSTSKPVIFFDIPIKKLNDDPINFDEIFEYKNRSKIGLILKSIDEIINVIKADKCVQKNEKFYLENFYNLGKSSSIILEKIKDLNSKIN